MRTSSPPHLMCEHTPAHRQGPHTNRHSNTLSSVGHRSPRLPSSVGILGEVDDVPARKRKAVSQEGREGQKWKEGGGEGGRG